MSKIEDILEERGARYGDFKDHAKICQDLKGVMNSVEGWSRLNPSQKQALEVIADKIARMLNGDPNYDDNWQDIIGYSQLVLNEMNEHVGQTKISFDVDLDEQDLLNIGTLSEGKGHIYKGKGDWLNVNSPEGGNLLKLTKLIDEIGDNEATPAYKEVNGERKDNYIAYDSIWYGVNHEIGKLLVDMYPVDHHALRDNEMTYENHEAGDH